METISRKAAAEAGQKFYFTGKPCRYGHITERYVSGYACKRCNLDRAEIWHSQNEESKEATRLKQRAKKYGVTPDYLEQLRVAQDNRCAGCNDIFTKRPHADHDHKTGEVRGLLCGLCNWALGHLRDNPVTLRRLADYLERQA